LNLANVDTSDRDRKKKKNEIERYRHREDEKIENGQWSVASASIF